jgi:hypothetical protein
MMTCEVKDENYTLYFESANWPHACGFPENVVWPISQKWDLTKHLGGGVVHMPVHWRAQSCKRSPFLVQRTSPSEATFCSCIILSGTSKCNPKGALYSRWCSDVDAGIRGYGTRSGGY